MGATAEAAERYQEAARILRGEPNLARHAFEAELEYITCRVELAEAAPARRQLEALLDEMAAAHPAALVLLVASGVGYRVAADRLATVTGSVPLPRGTLSALPLDIDHWTGRDVVLSDEIIQATDTDDHVNRNYVRRGSMQGVSFYVAYGVRFRDLTPHRPEVCYPGAGWTLDRSDDLDIELGEGTVLPCKLYRFSRGGLDTRRMTVLNYYVVDNQYCRDVGLLRSKSWRVDTDASYVAQVQITCAEDAFLNQSEELVGEFAGVSGPVVRQLLADAVAHAVADQDQRD